MFWTVFFAVLLVLYIIGYIICFGIILSVRTNFPEKWDINDYLALFIAPLTSWFGVGIKLGQLNDL